MITGFAVKNERGEVLIKTVSNTERAAMVNWLVTETEIAVLPHWSDAKIKAVFDALAAQMSASIVPVEVREVS